MSDGIIKGGSFKWLLLTILVIFLFFSLVSSLVIYERLHVDLSPHYGATISLLTQVKESLIITTIKINLIFYLLIAVGVTLLGILYSHRIAGPLFRVRKYAAALGEGRFHERINFREKDALHDLSSVLNELAEGCQDRAELLASQLSELQENLSTLSSLEDNAEEKIELIGRLRQLDARIIEENQKIKL